MGFYKYLREAWKNPSDEVKAEMRSRLIEWRREPVTLRIEKPTRLDRARSLGYQAKQGFIVVRQRVIRGGRQRPKITGGRRPKHFGRMKTVSKSYQQVAEERAAKSFKNCEVLNSYYVAQDGIYFWYEVILVDRAHPQVLADSRVAWISQHRGRAARGLTSAGHRTRGLHKKGKGVEKARPSLRANLRTLR